MLCHITGTLYKPDGTAYAGAFVNITSVPNSIESAYLGSVVPRILTVRTDANGNVDFNLLTGEYIVTTNNKRGEGGFVNFTRFNVPELPAAQFSDCIDAAEPVIIPAWLEQAITARDEAEAARDAAEAAAAEVEIIVADLIDDFETRADFVAWVGAGNVPSVGAVVNAAGYSYRYVGGVTTLPGLSGWVPQGPATQPHFGAVGDYNTDDTAAIDAWLAYFTITKRPLYHAAGVFRYHNKRMEFPEGVIITGPGGPRISTFPLTSPEKVKLRPGYKHTLSGAVTIFSGTPSQPPITTTRTDRFSSISPMAAYLHYGRADISGFDFVQDMDVRTSADAWTTPAMDNRANFDAGFVNKGYGLRFNCGIWGYLPKMGFINAAIVGDGILDPDYVDVSRSTINSGVAVIGPPDTATADTGNTGFKGTSVEIYGCDYHIRADSDPNVPALLVDGETGGSGAGMRGISLVASSFRTYANNAISLGACDDVSLIGCTTEFSTVAGVPGLDSEGVISGTAETNNITLIGLAATGQLGIPALCAAISGQFTIAQSGGFDGLISGKGGGGVASKLAAVRISGNAQQDPAIQFTDNLSSTVSGWVVRMDESDSDALKISWANVEQFVVRSDGSIRMPNLPTSSAGLIGTNVLWKDAANGNVVKAT